MNELMLYSAKCKRSRIRLWAGRPTVHLLLTKMAELCFRHCKPIPTSLSRQNGDQIISQNDSLLVPSPGILRNLRRERAATSFYLEYDQCCNQKKVRQADAQDDTELKSLENTLKKLPKP